MISEQPLLKVNAHRLAQYQHHLTGPNQSRIDFGGGDLVLVVADEE
jgi:hypothetical protein